MHGDPPPGVFIGTLVYTPKDVNPHDGDPPRETPFEARVRSLGTRVGSWTQGP